MKHRGTETQRGKGADWCVDEVYTQPNFVPSVSLCFKIRPRDARKGNTEAQRHRGRRGRGEQKIEWVGEDWYRDAVSNQSNFVPSVSLCFKSVRGCAEGKHRGTETQREDGKG